ncbi:MAG: tetratricopeptide repeat protein [Pyrinomonadaceae bacterium]
MNIKTEFRWLILLALIAFFVFANSMSGDFVYDDNRQILRNPLIQDAGLYGKALTSDVWAFKGDGSVAASNYWRPTFTAWSILNFQLFGPNPVGWHLLNLLLHVGVCILAFLLLRRWNLLPVIAFAISAIFAVHPVHTESVAWISGSPDLLFSLFLLASLWFAENVSRKGAKAQEEDKKGSLINSFDLILSLIFYALALGAKEVALLCIPLFYLIFTRKNDEKDKQIAASPLFRIFPFLLVGAVYFVARWIILGAVSKPAEDAASFGSSVLSVPAMFVFYLKQIIFPLWLGANYSLRPVIQVNLTNFVLPLIISIAAFVVFYLLAKRSFIAKLGFAIFILPLVPTMNSMALLSEQIVHDRYLYLPLLGFLMMILPYLIEKIEKIIKKNEINVAFILTIVLGLPLVFQTFVYNRVWASNLSLWQHNVKIDSTSASNWLQLGAELLEREKYNEAAEAYNNSIDIKPSPLALMGRARIFIAQNQLEEAVWDLQTVTELPSDQVNAYTLYQSYEALAIAFSQQNKPEKAVQFLTDARKRLPIYYAALTEKLAVVYYGQNRKDLALKELEGAKKQAKVELLPESKTIFLRLGMLYAEQGKNQEAKEALQEYLKATNNLQDKFTQQDRKQATDLLKQLK